MKVLKSIILTVSFLALAACAKSGPQEISLGKDQCENCKMSITDAKYATQLVTEKGRNYKFDDISCMQSYATSNPDKSKNATTYVADFPSGEFFDSSTATFINGGTIKSPMGGNTQAYKNKTAAEQAAQELGATLSQ